MHAVMIDAARDLVWTEVPDPVPKPGDVLLAIEAAALNRADLLQRAGSYPPPPGWPDWPGLEAAGTVLQAPADSRFQPGDSVCALLGGGGYAEKVAVPEPLVLPAPEGLSHVEAAALPEAFATSYLNLMLEGGFKEGETVFLQAGASGLGMAAIQMIKALGGTVITTVGSPEKADLVRRLGADVAVNHRTDDLLAVLDENPVDVALDCVAGPLLGESLKRMAPGGRWIVIATLGGSEAVLDMNLFFRHGLRLIGSTLRSRPQPLKAKVMAALERDLWPKLADRTMRPVIHAVLPMTETAAAHAILERRENLGKVILTTPERA